VAGLEATWRSPRLLYRAWGRGGGCLLDIWTIEGLVCMFFSLLGAVTSTLLETPLSLSTVQGAYAPSSGEVAKEFLMVLGRRAAEQLEEGAEGMQSSPLV